MWYNRLHDSDKKFHFHIELTTKCNAACPICPRFIKYTPIRSHNIELWEMTIDKVKEWFPKEIIKKVGSINFCGNFGDPCSCRDIYEIVEYFHINNKEIDIDIRTNGGAQSVSFWQKMGNLSKNSNKKVKVVFSVDGLEDTNDLYRRNVKWEILDRNIRTFTSNGGFGVQEFLIFNHNEHQIQEAKDQNYEWGLQYINYKQAFGFEDYDNNKQKPYPVYDKNGHLEYFLKPSLEYTNSSLEYDSNVSDISTKIDIYPDLTPTELEPINYSKYIELQGNEIICQSSVAHGGNLEVYFNANGDVRPCCHTGVDIDRRLNSETSKQLIEILSPKKDFNLNTNSFENILKLFDDKFVNKWNSTHEEGRCFKCSIQCGRVHQSNSERLYGADVEIKKKIGYFDYDNLDDDNSEDVYLNIQTDFKNNKLI